MTNVGFAKAIEHIFFIHSQENADVEWKFTRTQMWLEWIDRINNVPVPFNLLYFILRCLFSECFKKCCCEGVSGQRSRNIYLRVEVKGVNERHSRGELGASLFTE